MEFAAVKLRGGDDGHVTLAPHHRQRANAEAATVQLPEP